MGLTDNFNKLSEKKDGEPSPPEIERYDAPDSVRNLCFVQPDGKRLFLNYAYLVSGEYVPEEDSINLVFTTHTVKLTGHHLDALYESLAEHVPKKIACVDKRYEATEGETEAVVTGMDIKNP